MTSKVSMAIAFRSPFAFPHFPLSSFSLSPGLHFLSFSPFSDERDRETHPPLLGFDLLCCDRRSTHTPPSNHTPTTVDQLTFSRQIALKAKKNSDNRQLLKTMKNGGIKLDKMAMFIVTHKSNGGDETMEDHLSQIPKSMLVKEARDKAFTILFGEGGHGRMPMIGTHVPLLVAQQHREEIMQEQLVAANKKAERTEEFARVTGRPCEC